MENASLGLPGTENPQSTKENKETDDMLMHDEYAK